MFAALLGPLLSSLLNGIFGAVDKAIPDADLAAKIKAEIQSQVMNFQTLLLQSATSIILAETNGQSWLQRNWRPLFMMVLMTIVANNYIVAPYMDALLRWKVVLELPDFMWELMKIGLGGYIIGKSAEQVAANVATVLKKS